MHLIGVDWGTSNRRAYLLDTNGQQLDKREDGTGVLALNGKDFGASLDAWLEDWFAKGPYRLWLTGMVGSRIGWQEVPYLSAPTPLSALVRSPVPLSGRDNTWLLPGVSQKMPVGQADVMRGEEAQLLGAWRQCRRDGWYVLPGTHSKWVYMEDGVIRRFRTYMTGELFAQLSRNGTLAAVMDGAGEIGEAFDAGIQRGFNGGLEELFSIRAGVLLGELTSADAPSYLSGMLIGCEWGAALRARVDRFAPLAIIASPALAERHARAAALFGVPVELIEPDQCYVHALRQLADAVDKF
jgi:2-dehydro-3-deoxygalactonokinase